MCLQPCYLGGASLDCACRPVGHVGFDFFVVAEIDMYLDGASLVCVCSHDGFYLCGAIAFAAMSLPSSSFSSDPVIISSDLGMAARHRACSHVVLCKVDEAGKTHRQ
ncbi:hypothetical protein Tco_1036860 [Tanacetum coccineum]